MTTFDKGASYYGLGLTLGNAEVRLDELVSADSMLARGGVSLRPAFLKDTRSEPVERVLSARAAHWVSDILSDAEAREYVFGRGGGLEFPFPVAAKTGTSQAYNDNWAVGYTREITVGVWVGNFDRTPLKSSSGVTGAGPIFHAALAAVLRRLGSAVAAGSRVRHRSSASRCCPPQRVPARNGNELMVPAQALESVATNPPRCRVHKHVA
jgi:penicillin-binding protein 1C